MKKEKVTMTVTMEVTVPQALVLREMFRCWNQLSSSGTSRHVSFYCDVDDDFHPHVQTLFSSDFPEFSEEEEKEIQKLAQISEEAENIRFDCNNIEGFLHNLKDKKKQEYGEAVEKYPIWSKLSFKCYYMNDNHTFKPFDLFAPDFLQKLIEYEEKRPCGMLCDVTVYYDGLEKERIGSCVHSHGKFEPDFFKSSVPKWYKEIMEHPIIVYYLKSKATSCPLCGNCGKQTSQRPT